MKKILVIDDNTFFPKTITLALDPKEYEVSSVTSGEEGLKMIEKSMPDAILLDVKMPGGMDGLEFLKKLKETYKDSNIPVLITSNISSMEIVGEGVSLGVRGYIIKSDESLKTIAKAVDGLFKVE